jgi:hypothetical protein
MRQVYSSLTLSSSNRRFVQVQSLISSGHYTWSHLIRLVAAEFLRLAAEKSLDSFAYVSLTFGLTTR